MNKVEIAVKEYYDKPEYFPYMPEVIYNALESAFIEGKETAEVPKADFENMLLEYQSAK